MTSPRVAAPEGGSAIDLSGLGTETANPRSADLDVMSTLDLLRVMNAEDHTVPRAVERALPTIAQAVDLIVSSRHLGGRLVYLGAGTSGRIGLLDAVECPPTFGTDPDEVLGVIAGGDGAFLHAVEGGLAYARTLGAATVSLACNRRAAISAAADVAIEIDTGPEILTGSTRLKAGTAQKLVCNMLSTASMVRTGKVYRNLMVDVQPTNAKLVDRSIRIVAAATDVDAATARDAVDQAGGNAKTAIVMLLTGCGADEARQRLALNDGRVRPAVAR